MPAVSYARRVLWVSPRRRLKTAAAAAPVPLCDELAAALAAWLPEAGTPWVFPGVRGKGPWTGGMPGGKPLDRLKAAGREAGLEGVTFQSLRHSCATLLEARGVPEVVIQRVLRHTTPRTTARYRHADVAALVGWVKGVGYPSAASSPSIFKTAS
jgi:integrase